MSLLGKEKRCSKCGETFGCGGLLGCWCRDVELDAAARALLKERYDDCLCPSCLKEFSTPSRVAEDVV